MFRQLSVPLLLLVSFPSFAPAVAAEKNPSQLEITTQRAIIFKDGYALIIKRGVATTDKSGEVYTDDVPDAAVLGSFSALPEQGRLISMLAGWKSTKDADDKQMPCTQPIEILQANKGKQAKIELHDKTMYNGIIQEVLVESTDAPLTPAQLELLELPVASAVVRPAATAATSFLSSVPATRVKRLSATDTTSEHVLSTIAGSNFVLRTDGGDVLLPVAQVRSISVPDMKTTIARTLTTSKKTKRLSLKFDGGAGKKQAVTIMYFRPGIRWIPTYRVLLSDKKDKQDKKTAEVSLQAELLNEAEDLDDVPVDIVVGVPNFRFKGTPSPITLEGTLRNALAQAAPDLMMNNGNSLSNAIYSQRVGDFRRDQAHANAAADGVVNLPGELTAGGAQDLFVYNLPKITLGKSDRIAVPIFTTEVPYRDLYTWDVRVSKQDNEAAPAGDSKSPLTLSKNEVWHQILLTNSTNLPWTTGAVMIMQGNQPLAQELLTYTPPKDEVRVPVTVSVDTRGSLSEKETGRELNSLQWDNHTYARIDKQMKLDLCNNKNIEIEAEITLKLGGKVNKASDDGNITLGAFDAADWVNYQGHPAVNNSSTVTWKVKLKPGDNFEPTVNYHHYTRH